MGLSIALRGSGPDEEPEDNEVSQNADGRDRKKRKEKISGGWFNVY